MCDFSDVAATRAPLFHIQLLVVGCMGLAVDFGRFRVAISSACPLCGSSREDVYHFIVVCPQLVNVCSSFCSPLPPFIVSDFDILL